LNQPLIPLFCFNLMRPKFQKRSAFKLDSRISKSQVSEAKRTEICWTNYPLCKAQRDIPLAKQGGTDTIKNTPKLALGFIRVILPGAFVPVVVQIA